MDTRMQKRIQIIEKVLATPPVLTRPLPDDIFYLYLAVSEEVVSDVLIRELDSN